MTPKGERRLGRFVGIAGIVLGIAGAALVADALARKGRPRPSILGRSESRIAAADVGEPSKDIGLLVAKKMSKAIVKSVIAPPPAPPKPPAPALETLVRLAGVMDFGGDRPKEAFIEVRPGNQTKAYKAGEVLVNPAIRVKAIADSVILEYDGKLWRLTSRGVEKSDPPGP